MMMWVLWCALSGLLTYIGLPFYICLQNQQKAYEAAVKAGDPNADALKVRWFDKVILLLFGLADVTLNVFMSGPLLDLPWQQAGGHREITFSQRLKRLIKRIDWRGKVATWIFKTFIFRIDPTHLD